MVEFWTKPKIWLGKNKWQMVTISIRFRNTIRNISRWSQTTKWKWREWKIRWQRWVIGRCIPMDKRYELKARVWKLNLLTEVKIVCRQGVWRNACKKDFSKFEWNLFWLEGDDINNTLDASIGLVWLS
jgi:hypothetical protein